ncbi:TolC family protein [Paraflavitalea pollutisoli]|uniref:TolC family protein n=1 Tax=Paraflavitalea pollutisoli TaxID=3034143 RepID=UPI0023EC8BA0|nr:TolC family protein [Paraflavitalea sp. H1-2-19X]
MHFISARTLLLWLLLLSGTRLLAQRPAVYSLNDIISRAQMQSYSYKLAATQKEISFYRFRTFSSEFKPQVSLYGNAPVYNKEYYAVRQPDGAISYQLIEQSNNNIGLGISQRLPFSGGTISLNTDLSRFDNFQTKTKQYSGTPVYLQLNQPLFAVNELKWNRLIETLKFDESQKQFAFDREQIAQVAVGLFFGILEAQNNIDIATTNLLVAQENYEIEKKRVNLGTTSEDRLLQLELQMLRSKQDLERAKYDHTIAQLNLNMYIGIKEEKILLIEPVQSKKLSIDLAEATSHAKKNRPEFIAFQRRTREAQRDVAVARAATQQVNLTASYGLSHIGTQVGDVYQNPNNQQRLSIGFNIPLVDWGRRKARYHTARALEKLTATSNEFEEANIFQAIEILINNMTLLESNIDLARKTDSVAHRRYILANDLYQIGKLSVTDLSFAQSEKDNSRRNYINALRAFWDCYYQLRKQTLYDFEKHESLLRTSTPDNTN